MKKINFAVILVLVGAILLLPTVNKTSSSERVIIDHSTHEIVHPSCFDEKKFTNWIDEVTYKDALEYYEYSVRDECTKESMPEGKTSIINRLLEK